MAALSKTINQYKKFRYEVPQRYRDSFYLANAAFVDNVGWFVHRAYEVSYEALINAHQDLDRFKSTPPIEVVDHIKTTIAMFDQCNSIIDVRFPVQRDSGKKEIIRGFRALHGLFSGLQTALGGFRIKEDLTRDHVKALAALTTYKHSCLGIRLGGAHGGVKINPKGYSEGELKRIVQGYCTELFRKGYCNGINDIIEPDINTSQREIDWIASTIANDLGKMVVVGKSVKMGGLEHHEKTAAQGIYFALDYFLNNEDMLMRLDIHASGLNGKTFIIQGLGKMGTNLMQYLEHSGAKCVGVKEHDSYIYERTGINIKSILEHKQKHGTIIGFNKVKALSDDVIFTKECDILILCAMQKSLVCYTADKVKAKIIVEAANGSITPTAHRTLVGRSKLVLPDIYISSGYSIASYIEHLLLLKRKNQDLRLVRGIYRPLLDNFELDGRALVSVEKTQKMRDCQIEPNTLTFAIEHVMTQTADELMDIAKSFQLDLDLRTAAYIKAIRTLHYSLFDEKK